MTLAKIIDEISESMLIDKPRCRHEDLPYLKISYAVLRRAINDLTKKEQMKNEENKELIRWFNSKDTSYPFSFRSICLTLDLEPQSVLAFVNTGSYKI